MDKSLLNPIGPLGSIVIGVVLLVLTYTRVTPPLHWLGLAFVMGGLIMLLVRIMNKKQDKLPH